MISGLFVDVALVAAVGAFAWAGFQLGGVASTLRTIGVLAAFGLAALLRDPAGDLVHSISGKSIEFSRLMAMAGVAMFSYGAFEKLFGWLLARRAERREELEDEYGDAIEDRLMDTLDTGRAGAIAGGLIGYCWALLFVMLLILTPRDSFYSRAAIRSFTGSVLIERETGLRWIVEGFPRYAQTLPKGELGAEAGVQDDLPMHGDVDPKPRPQDTDVLLRSLNTIRRADGGSTLVWNPEVAGVAQRHAESLAVAKTMQTTNVGGGSLDSQILASLGSAAGDFEDEPAVLLVWAHGPANAGAGIAADPTSVRTLRRAKWSEAGIGVADAGWFNGRIYVIALVAPRDTADSGSGAAAAGAGSDEDSAPTAGE